MKYDPKEQQREICNYVLAYLCDNPDAGDTFEGIAKWWLLHQRIKFETQNISKAVSRLVAEGLIVEQEGRDSRITYRVNGTRRQDIKDILSQAERR